MTRCFYNGDGCYDEDDYEDDDDNDDDDDDDDDGQKCDAELPLKAKSALHLALSGCWFDLAPPGVKRGY